VDYVVNAIIASGCFYANSTKTNIMHVGTSDRNPVTWLFSRDVVLNYWRTNPPSRKVGYPNFTMFKHYKAFRAMQFFKRKLPVYLYSGFAKLTMNTGRIKTAASLKKLIERENNIAM